MALSPYRRRVIFPPYMVENLRKSLFLEHRKRNGPPATQDCLPAVSPLHSSLRAESGDPVVVEIEPSAQRMPTGVSPEKCMHPPRASADATTDWNHRLAVRVGWQGSSDPARNVAVANRVPHVRTAEEPDSASKNMHLPAAGIRPLGVFVPDHFSRGLHLDVEHREHAPASFAEALSSSNMGSTASNFSVIESPHNMY